MGMMRVFALAAVLALAGAARAGAEDSDAARAARWRDVAASVFGGRPVTDGSAVLQMDAPVRALDAALVPISITVAPGAAPKAITVVIDDNPAPVAAIVHFGPLADPHVLKLRVRVDQYTLIHAVAEMPDGTLAGIGRLVKAAGGCSAPGTTDPAEAMARLGRMKLLAAAPAPDGAPEAELLISHPNYNGMQMDPVTRLYRPARYVQTVTISEAGRNVLRLDGDISLSQDPAITFALRSPHEDGPLDVHVEDSSHAAFDAHLTLPARGS